MIIAFYTIGDTRIVQSCPNITRSSVALTYAQRSGAQCHGVGTVALATAVLMGLQANSVNRVLFVGHGMPDGYFFSGTPHPRRDFEAYPHQIFKSGDTALMDELIRVLTRNCNESIEFHACNMGGGSLLTALANRIGAARSGCTVNLRAFTGNYRIRPVIDSNCQITGFSPPPMTAYPAGRLPAARP
jgi:hypothetical protein